MPFLSNLTGLTGFLVILGWWMSCFLIGWLKTKESIHWLIHVVEGISANSPVLPCVAGSFFVILVFGSCLCGLEEVKRKKPWEKGRGKERERRKICAFSSYSLPQRFQVWPRFSFRAAASLTVLCEPQKTASYASCACGIKSLSRNVITYASFVSCRLYCPTIGTLRSHDGDDNENLKKAIGLISKTTILQVNHAFLYISLPSPHDYDVKIPNFTMYRGSTQAKTKFSLSFWTWIWFLGIQL